MRPHLVLAASFVLAMISGGGAAVAQAAAPRRPVADGQPVRIGGGDGDACASRASRLSGTGSRGVAIRSGPGREFKIVGRLVSLRRQAVFVCDSAGADSWTGIVYGPAAGAGRCGVARAVTGDRRAYAGPCRQGWVPASAIAGTTD